MVKKLISFSRNRIPWPLAFKIAGAAIVLSLLYFSAFSWLAIFIFWGFFGYIYFAESFRRRSFRFSYWLLIFLAFVLIKIGLDYFWTPVLALALFLVFLALFFVVLGLIDFVFGDQFLVYNLFHSSFFLAVFGIFFYFRFSSSFLLLFGLFLVVLLLLEEFFVFNGIGWPKRRLVAEGVLALTAVQIAWLTSLLPIGFINSAAFLVLFLGLSRDAALAHFQGHFSIFYLFRQLTFFIILSLFIFFISSWSL
ncbi:MAG: hypothetical protein Q8L36_00815 [bacterium]|nr:hypothetical protein [bacterium]